MIIKCRLCNRPLRKFFSLGRLPLANSYLKKSQLRRTSKYDLSVGFCSNCLLVQLMKSLPPEKLFRKYLYFSSTSQSFLAHSKKTAQFLKRKLRLNSDSLVLEIASNDGAVLKYFQELGVRVIGIDPARNIAKIANSNGIKTIPEFFNYSMALKLFKKRLTADLVYGANVLAHVPGILDFVKGVKFILKQKGTVVFEFPYIKGLLEGKFDTIYHEHFFYYSLLALTNLFRKAGLVIYDVKMTPLQGGSLQIFISHPNVFITSNRVHKLLKKETSEGFHKLATYKKLSITVDNLKKELLELLKRLRQNNKSVAAYGAPAKGNTLLNFFGIGKNYLDFIVDKSPAKQGSFTPGTHLLIESPKVIMERKPDYLLILCWNIYKEILEDCRSYKKAGGKFIVPIPKLRII